MTFLLVLAAFLLAGNVECGNFTVTHEVWFEVEIKDLDGPGEDYRGKFTVALFGEVAPMTAYNFYAIARGHKKGQTKLHYKGTYVHRIVRDFVIQMGDVTTGDGTGGASIYGPRFNDEDFVLSHRSEGWVSMANHGPDTNSSQFFILLTKSRWLDGKHVVFGKIIRGYDLIRLMGELETDRFSQQPKKRVRIVECGATQLERSWDLKPSQLDSTDDVEEQK